MSLTDTWRCRAVCYLFRFTFDTLHEDLFLFEQFDCLVVSKLPTLHKWFDVRISFIRDVIHFFAFNVNLIFKMNCSVEVRFKCVCSCYAEYCKVLI